MTTQEHTPELVRAAKIALNSGVILEFPAPQSQVDFIHKAWVGYHERVDFQKEREDQTITVHAMDGGVYGFLLADISAVLNSIIPVPAVVDEDLVDEAVLSEG